MAASKEYLRIQINSYAVRVSISLATLPGILIQISYFFF